MKKIEVGSACVHFHSSEEITEVEPKSVRLLLGASVFLGKDAEWEDYRKLYQRVYVEQGLQLLRDDGFLVVIQTDAYTGGQVMPREKLLLDLLLSSGYKLVDEKIWKRAEINLFQPPFSQVMVLVKSDGSVGRADIRLRNYYRGVWDFPQTQGSSIAGYPDELCELLVDAFTQPGDLLLDVFAGTANLVGIAGRRGRRAVGYEIDENLSLVIERNLSRADDFEALPLAETRVPPKWIAGDSVEMAKLLPPGEEYDFVFTCPPYFDLERYSDDTRDLSAQPWKEFLESYRRIIRESVSRLRPDRFACCVIGEVRERGGDGFYRNLVGETVSAFEEAGARYYNEAILVTALGSLPMRAGRTFSSTRKLGKTHQQVLVFCKGDPRKATEACGPISFADQLMPAQETPAAQSLGGEI